MAGGVVKKPVNIFKLKDLGEPAGVFNWRLWFAVFSFGMMGAARGVDEGLISGAFKSKNFQESINFHSYSEVDQANIKANVSAMVQIGCVGGALIAFLICDKIGRIWATRELCMVWVIGIAIFMANNGHLGAIYAGRFIAGLGVGQTAVVGPVYLAEISPAAVRGLCTCVFSGFVYLGIVLAYFANYGASLHMNPESADRWLVPTSVHIIFAGLIFILSIFQSESPRFLVMKGKTVEATKVLARLRQQDPESDYIVREIAAIEAAREHELESVSSSFLGTCKELFLNKSNLYRLYLASMVQILAQWSGAGSITLYAVDLFALLGIKGSETGLLVTALFGIIKLIAAVSCALFLVDVIGRKKALIGGISLQAIAMVYIAAFLTAVPNPEGTSAAARGAVAMIYISGIGWALGWNTMSYILTAELFPLQIRAFATSVAMMLHFLCQYGSTRATPNMLLPVSEGGISPAGTFWCYGAILVVGGIWVLISVPETAGRSLESMDRLFELPWYKIGLFGNRDADQRDIAYDEKKQAAESSHGECVYVEDKGPRAEKV